MRRGVGPIVRAIMRGWLVFFGVVVPGVASAQRWQDATSQCMGTTAQWTNKVEVADLDGDGNIDILTANGGNYSSAGTAEPPRIWKNLGGWTTNALHCAEITSMVAGSFTGLSRLIKAADVDGDGDLDVLTGGAYQTQLKLFVQGATGWSDASAQLPQQNTSAGDAEFGDVDGDGDLDLVIADWGTGNPSTNTGGRTRLYRNNGQGTFTDETTAAMPNLLVRWSWDLELADVDNDWDLDVLVSCKACTSSLLFRNNGMGVFTDEPDALPHFTNNYELEPMDIDADGDLDLVTVNDGLNVTEHIFVNRGDGTFADETAQRLTGTANPSGADDNAAVWLDADDDGDPDLMFATLGNERLLLNDGGIFTLDPMQATPNDTNGSLGIAVADFDGDHRPDILQGQGETAFPEKLQLGGANVGIDTHPPVIRAAKIGDVVVARVHDRIGPSHRHDFMSVVVRSNGVDTPMTWYGEQLWRVQAASLTAPIEVCATDRANNMACATVTVVGGDAGSNDGSNNPPPDDGDNGCCDTGGDGRGAFVLALLVVLVSARSRSTGRRSRSDSRRRS